MIIENCPYTRDPRVRREAKALAAAGYKVTVISPSEEKSVVTPPLVEGVTVYRFWKPAFPSTIVGHVLEYLFATLAIALISAYILVHDGFDIIHIANPPDSLIFITYVYKWLGKSVVYDQHDLCPELYAVKFGNADDLIARLLRWMERLSYTLADTVIVTNESYKQLAVSRGRVTESHVTIVRNGPDLESTRNGETDPEVRSKAPHILTFAGITEEQDGLDYLIRALHALRYQLGRAEFCCLVIGGGHALEGAKSLTRSLGLQNNLWFTGWISDPRTYWRYLATSDICVSPEPCNPYNDRSTFVKIMEYMAAGKPIVAFDLCETRFSAQQSAVYAKSSDEKEFAMAIARLMDDPDLRRSMGQAGQTRVRERLAWQYSAPVLLKVYEGLAKRYVVVPEAEKSMSAGVS